MEWRDIPGFGGAYKVSECGRVMSCERTIKSGRHPSGVKRLAAKEMKLTDWRGYKSLHLVKCGRRVRVKVHHLVALAFIGPWPETAQCVRHLDDVPSNNHRDNLAYGTIAENVGDSIRNGTFTRGELNGVAKLTNRQVADIKTRARSGERTGLLAKEFKVSPATISDIKFRRNWAHIEPRAT